MMYTFYRAFQKLWINKKTYFFIMIELAVGIAVVLCEICSVFSAHEKTEMCKRQIGEIGATIEYSGDFTFGAERKAGIDVEDYKTILDTYSDTEVSYILYAGGIYLDDVAEEVKDVDFVSMDKNTFADLFGFASEDDKIYLGAQVAEDLEKGGLRFVAEWISAEGADFKVGENDLLKPERLHSETQTIYFGLTHDLNVKTLVVLPEKYMKTIQDNNGYSWGLLRIMTDPEIDDSDMLQDILQMLQARHPEYSYHIADQYLELRGSVASFNADAHLFAYIAWIVLIISVVGIIGILLIYMEKRKRELAIVLALGGTRMTIFKEIFIEIFSLCLISGIIGTAAAAAVAPHLSNAVFDVSFRWISLAVMAGIVLMIPVISCTCIVLEIRNVHPMKILKK